jgi:CDP-diacylglycerol--serine O-phosphatidyltransferase
MLRFMNAANALSLAGLAAALSSAILAIHGRAAHALVALMVSGLCDLFDGFVARKLVRTDDERRFGAHLDSAVDACSFGLAPAILLHTFGLRSTPELALLAIFASCAVWRLAYFDTVGLSDEGGARYYTGLPVTYVALVLPVACLPGFLSASTLRGAAIASAIGLATAMVSPFRIRKPAGKWYAVLLGVAAVVIAVYAGGAPRFPPH